MSGPRGRLGRVRVLVVGSGGREHALARALARDGDVTELHAAPGNPGIAGIAQVHDVALASPAAIAALAARLGAGLVVIGPEAPLVAGAADAVRAAGMSCAGDAEVSDALAVFGPPYVVKADGLAAGKGVVVTTDRAEAARHAARCGTVLIEEFLDGPEVSVFALADGSAAVPLLPAQDYKRAHDGDTGPNTGGMGAYAPLPWAPPGLADEVIARVIQPALDEVRRRGTPYSGLLYAGLCLTSAGIRVVEFNARFGDPETQVVLDRLVTPLAGLLGAAANGGLAGAGVTVVIAAEGYPAAPASGDQIDGLEDAEREPAAYVLHAGTSADGAGPLRSSGGRVLNVVGPGPQLAGARAAAYRAASLITMRGGWYRTDIAADAGP